MKQVVITVLIACTAAVFTPRDVREASTLAVRAGIVLIQIGLMIGRGAYDGYDAGFEPDDIPPQQDAGARSAGSKHVVFT